MGPNFLFEKLGFGLRRGDSIEILSDTSFFLRRRLSENQPFPLLFNESRIRLELFFFRRFARLFLLFKREFAPFLQVWALFSV